MKVRIKYDRLRECCLQSEQELVSTLPNRGYTEAKGLVNSAWFKDRGSNVLAVAHMDTVQKDKYFGLLSIPKDTVIYSPYLDDRVGVYTVTDLLPSLGIKTDVLLTMGEESCQSSARIFKAAKKYNWIVEFDRRGDDVVTYGMDTKVFRGAMDKSNMVLGRGSYSDISELGSLGCCAMNMGVGYHNEHSIKAHMMVSEYIKNMKRFVRFFWKNKDTRYEHKSYGNRSSRQKMLSWWDDDDAYVRPSTPLGQGKELNEVTGNVIDKDNMRCPDCGLVMDNEYDNVYYCYPCNEAWQYDYDLERFRLIERDDEDLMASEEAMFDGQLDTKG